MAQESDDQRPGREADARSDFRSFVSSFRTAVSYLAQGMDEQAAPHVAAARDDGRALLAHVLRREPTEAEVESWIRF